MRAQHFWVTAILPSNLLVFVNKLKEVVGTVDTSLSTVMIFVLTRLASRAFIGWRLGGGGGGIGAHV